MWQAPHFLYIFSPFSNEAVVNKAKIDSISVAEVVEDVAAGIAILEGAGGKFTMTKGGSDYSLNVSADNHVIDQQYL